MESFKEIMSWYFEYWIFTVPLSIWVITIIIPELLDLIFNTGKLNQLLKDSDELNIDSMKTEFDKQKKKLNNLNPSYLLDAKRQFEFTKLQSSRKIWPHSSKPINRQKIIAAKNLSDIFRIDKS